MSLYFVSFESLNTYLNLFSFHFSFMILSVLIFDAVADNAINFDTGTIR
jgi:hypothetical protein